MPASKESTKALLDLALTADDPKVAKGAGSYLPYGNRRIDFSLTENQIVAILARLRDKNGRIAADWAYVAARATNMEHRLLVEPIVERLKQAVSEAPQAPNQYDSYLTSEASYLNRFTRVFRFLNGDSTISLLRKEITASQDQRLTLWLTIAAGMAGDASVGDTLLQTVENDSFDSSVRAVALRAYAVALRDAAGPILERYRDDQTRGPDPRTPPMRLVAHDELGRLRSGRTR
jgi:hypothetical protein